MEGMSKGERLQLMHMVVWMLQRELLQQLRRYDGVGGCGG